VAGVLAVNGAAALNAGLIPDDEVPGSRDRPWTRVGGAHLRPRWCSRALERPGDSPALVPARRIEDARCPKRRRSARAPCSATLRHTGNTPKTPGHRTVSSRYPRHRSF